jgi:exosome complex exonuclease RRP6
MIKDLKEQSEIAVDVEHSSRSYEGLTCLLQFSTRNNDYIVDVFPIWQSLPALKEVM